MKSAIGRPVEFNERFSDGSVKMFKGTLIHFGIGCDSFDGVGMHYTEAVVEIENGFVATTLVSRIRFTDVVPPPQEPPQDTTK